MIEIIALVILFWISYKLHKASKEQEKNESEYSNTIHQVSFGYLKDGESARDLT